MGHYVVLLDISKYMVQLAQNYLKEKIKEGRVELVCGDIRMMGLEGKIFDFALCEADPIAQCGDFKQALRALKEIRRVLKDDCVLVGSTSERINRVLSEIIKADDLQCLKNVCSVLRGIYQAIENEPNSRMYLFTSNELRKALEEAGFEVLEFSPILIVSQFLPENLKRRNISRLCSS